MKPITRPMLVWIGVALSTLVLSLGAAAASPVLTERDWKTAGDKMLTYDSTTQFEWLDVTQSMNRTFANAASQFGSGGAFQGFRHATWAEVLAFMADSGISSSVNGANLAAAYTLMGMIGGVNYEPTYPFRSTDAFTSDVVPGFPNARLLGSLVINTGLSAGPSATLDEMFDVNFRYPTVGHWLLRDTAALVPEPETWAMLLAGLGLLGFAARRGKQKNAAY
jgi:hypothetical protein